jgi:hypothetical protein
LFWFVIVRYRSLSFVNVRQKGGIRMKKLICLILVFSMLVPCALAESIDLSGMTFEELVALKEKINLAIWQCQEWQEVTVPQGVWKVGEDIPAGTWTVYCLPEQSSQIIWGDALDKNGTGINFSNCDRYGVAMIYSKSYLIYKEGDMTEYTFTVNAGDYIVIKQSSIIFTPYNGKPDLGFK